MAAGAQNIDVDEIARSLADGRPFEQTDQALKISLYLPDKDANNRPIANMTEWIDEATHVLQIACGGVTAYPAAIGKWENPVTKMTTTESTVIVYAFIFDIDRFRKELPNVTDFVHAFASETNQGQVFLEIGTQVVKISFL